MVQLRPGGPPASPRGGSASEEVVELYQLLYTADGHWGSRRSPTSCRAFRSHAYRQYRDAQTAHGVPIKDDKWSDREKRTAWLWWVGELITTTRPETDHRYGPGREQADGQAPDQLVSTANRNKPPLVVQRVTEDRLVHWTPNDR